ncbi:hypothetical protein ACSBL2_15270 [Pedobacter sp. AW31-3R]|uniref:hypothetical protein n=1 Tax=Pedobacter sp. AW31-3R TaxID=3445781 RepID=UPI003F9FC7F5
MKHIYKITSLFLLLIILAGCKKEYQEYTFKDIISFNMEDAHGEPLKGFISNNEIVINWPVEQELPDHISPQINIAERARISPASGTEVKLENGTTYTVTAEDGSTEVYKIRLVLKSIPPFIRQTSLRTGNSKVFALQSASVTISGDYFNPNLEKTKVFFIDAQNVETQAVVSRLTEISITTKVPFELGTYKMKVVSNTDTIFYADAFDVIAVYAAPTLPYNALAVPLVLKRGDSFTVTGGTLLSGVNTAQLGSFTLPVSTANLIVTQATNESVVFKVPDTTPIGVYQQLIYNYIPAGYYNAGGSAISANITIIE